jgi:hypothetical protein
VSKAEYPGQDALVYFALVPASLKNLKVHLDTQFCFSSIMAEIEIIGLFFALFKSHIGLVRFLRSGQKWMKLPEQNDSK